jgi:hypothetical protein
MAVFLTTNFSDKTIKGKMIFSLCFLVVKVEPALCAGFVHLRGPT